MGAGSPVGSVRLVASFGHCVLTSVLFAQRHSFQDPLEARVDVEHFLGLPDDARDLALEAAGERLLFGSHGRGDGVHLRTPSASAGRGLSKLYGGYEFLAFASGLGQCVAGRLL